MMKKINKKLAFYVILGVICSLSFILRIPSFTFPLDYDVGGHLFYGMEVATRGFYLTLQEIRPVGILVIFALIYKVFGSSSVWVNIVGASSWVFSTYLLYNITKILFGSRKTALFASLIFTFFASSRALQGEMANMESFFIPFSLFGIYFFFLAKKKVKKVYFVLSGLSFGVAFLTKHLAVFDFLAVFLFNLFLFFSPKIKFSVLKKKSRLFIEENLALISGLLISILLVSLYFFFIGQLEDFFYYQFIKIHSNVNVHHFLGNALVNLKNNFLPIFSKTYFFWLLSFLGVVSTFFFKHQFKRSFLFFWILTVFGGIAYLWWFFPHHFLQLTPPLSIFAAFFLTDFLSPGEKKLSGSRLAMRNGLVISILFFGFIIFFKTDAVYFSSFFQKVKGEISKKEHLTAVGFDAGPDGWLSLYETADYLKKEMKPWETVFIWSSLPTIYALAEKQPISWFIYKYPLLPDELRPMGFWNWFPNVNESRMKMMEDLVKKFPEYILVRAEPERIFDEMFSFSEFSNFIVKNYIFDQMFGHVLVYKRIGKKPEASAGKMVPFEIIKRLAVITKIEKVGSQTKVIFEPMVNPSGILRSFQVIYPEMIEVNFKPMTVEVLGQDGQDLVGWALYQSSGTIDLHFRVKGVQKLISFVRIKMGKTTWNNRSYGVNSPLKVIEKEGIVDLYFEPPSDWQKQTFDVYFIFEDGTLSCGV